MKAKPTDPLTAKMLRDLPDVLVQLYDKLDAENAEKLLVNITYRNRHDPSHNIFAGIRQ